MRECKLEKNAGEKVGTFVRCFAQVGYIQLVRAVHIISKLNFYYFGYFDPLYVFFDNKNN